MNDIEKPNNDKKKLINLDFNQVVLESNEFTLQELETMENYTKKKYYDAIYMGQMINGKRQGKGLMKYVKG